MGATPAQRATRTTASWDYGHAKPSNAITAMIAPTPGQLAQPCTLNRPRAKNDFNRAQSPGARATRQQSRLMVYPTDEYLACHFKASFLIPKSAYEDILYPFHDFRQQLPT